MERKKYEVTVGTCDDSTTVGLLLTDAEADTLRYLHDRIVEAEGHDCGPRVVVEEVA